MGGGARLSEDGEVGVLQTNASPDSHARFTLALFW